MITFTELYIRLANTSTKIDINGTDESKSVQNVWNFSADSVLSGILTMTYYFIGVAAVISMIVGGIMYATSAGDPSQVTKAKNIILYSVVGLIVAIMAFAITGFVINRVG